MPTDAEMWRLLGFGSLVLWFGWWLESKVRNWLQGSG